MICGLCLFDGSSNYVLEALANESRSQTVSSVKAYRGYSDASKCKGPTPDDGRTHSHVWG